jgi:hypothetical protein
VGHPRFLFLFKFLVDIPLQIYISIRRCVWCHLRFVTRHLAGFNSPRVGSWSAVFFFKSLVYIEVYEHDTLPVIDVYGLIRCTPSLSILPRPKIQQAFRVQLPHLNSADGYGFPLLPFNELGALVLNAKKSLDIRAHRITAGFEGCQLIRRADSDLPT